MGQSGSSNETLSIGDDDPTDVDIPECEENVFGMSSTIIDPHQGMGQSGSSNETLSIGDDDSTDVDITECEENVFGMSSRIFDPHQGMGQSGSSNETLSIGDDDPTDVDIPECEENVFGMSSRIIDPHQGMGQSGSSNETLSIGDDDPTDVDIPECEENVFGMSLRIIDPHQEMARSKRNRRARHSDLGIVDIKENLYWGIQGDYWHILHLRLFNCISDCGFSQTFVQGMAPSNRKGNSGAGHSDLSNVDIEVRRHNNIVGRVEWIRTMLFNAGERIPDGFEEVDIVKTVLGDKVLAGRIFSFESVV